jgi:PHD/YefM family antitoxin component YafN of YafNO toxin-antitoxin module
MNTITIAEIKRGGMDALDTALHRGAATIMKRNRPAAIVLTPDAYEALLVKATAARTLPSQAPMSALDWLLSGADTQAQSSSPVLDSAAMQQRIGDLRADWQER